MLLKQGWAHRAFAAIVVVLKPYAACDGLRSNLNFGHVRPKQWYHLLATLGEVLTMTGRRQNDTSADIELAELLQQNQNQLETLGRQLIAGNKEACIGTLVGLVTGVASGSPMLGAFATAGVKRAFAKTATKRLLAEYNAYEKEKEQEKARERFVGDLSSAVETLLGQSVLQLVRVQHNIKDEVLQALGGVRDDLRDFRNEFEAAIPADEREAVRVDLQEVTSGSIGIHVSNSSRQRAFIARQIVSGAGSVGIKLG